MGLKKQIMDHTNCGTKIEPHEGVKRNDRCDNNKKSQIAPITNKHFQISPPNFMHMLVKYHQSLG